MSDLAANYRNWELVQEIEKLKLYIIKLEKEIKELKEALYGPK